MEIRLPIKNKVCLWLSFCSVAIAFFYSLFILAHIDHDCDGEGCAVCAQLRLAGDFLRRLELCADKASFVFLFVGLLTAYAQLNAAFLFAADPVSLKVRLNN
ncbi:MAG: hypothetical protein LBO03_01465 [Acidaminococcales bacterium]|nr:hypothetical protein [Acidaminococcales bacterium]